MKKYADEQQAANEREKKFDDSFKPLPGTIRSPHPDRGPAVRYGRGWGYGVVTGQTNELMPRRFLMLPELHAVERWKFEQVIDHPFFREGPYLVWQSNYGRSVQINRDLFYAQMKGTL